MIWTDHQRWTLAQRETADAYGQGQWALQRHEVIVDGQLLVSMGREDVFYYGMNDAVTSRNGNFIGGIHGSMSDPAAVAWELDGVAIEPTSDIRCGTGFEITQTGLEGYAGGVQVLDATVYYYFHDEVYYNQTAFESTQDDVSVLVNYAGMTQPDLCEDEAWEEFVVAAETFRSNADCPTFSPSSLVGPTTTTFDLTGPGGTLTTTANVAGELVMVDDKMYMRYDQNEERDIGEIDTFQVTRTLVPD